MSTRLTLLLLAATAVLLTQVVQAAPKPCEALKAEIAARLDAKGVKGYALTAVANDQAGQARVVGSCDGGTKKLTYTRP
jgi:hypothetical protein